MTIEALLSGKTVKLTRLTTDDIPTLLKWYEDTRFNRLFDARPALGQSKQALESWLGEAGKKNEFVFGIRLRETGELIGQADLDGVNWVNGACYLSIGIGSEAHRGKGYGTETIHLLLAFAFSELNLHRVTATIFSYNDASVAAFEKCGFTREGAFREFIHRDGQRYDMIIFGILRREWEAIEEKRNGA